MFLGNISLHDKNYFNQIYNLTVFMEDQKINKSHNQLDPLPQKKM